MFNNNFEHVQKEATVTKSDETRAKITETAIASFRERGYDQTTIRLIADEAKISVGNAYYYFPTKNHLVQELYLRVQREHLARVADAFTTTTDIAKRLEIALLAGLDALGPYHASAPGFLTAAISPRSAVSPFGPDSAEPRELVLQVFRQVVDGSTNTIPLGLKRQLPELLWMAYMGLALYWVYDTSPGETKSRILASRASKLFSTVLPLTRLPFARGPLNELLGLISEARS
jgi:AcrR family transcriptional regulator